MIMLLGSVISYSGHVEDGVINDIINMMLLTQLMLFHQHLDSSKVEFALIVSSGKQTHRHTPMHQTRLCLQKLRAARFTSMS